MGRTRFSTQRQSETKRTHIGRVIIFCEGKTEKYYFDYFSEIIKKNKYSDVEVVLETVGGNAQTTLNFADDFMTKEENGRKFYNYQKYLAFDCDDPPDIQSVILSSKKYELLISNDFFETWLLMHFEELDEKLSRRETYRRLTEHLRGKYSKGDQGKTREIIQNGDIEKAIENAKALESGYLGQGKNTFANIKEMNPYTSVHKLIEQFMFEISE